MTVQNQHTFCQIITGETLDTLQVNINEYLTSPTHIGSRVTYTCKLHGSIGVMNNYIPRLYTQMIVQVPK